MSFPSDFAPELLIALVYITVGWAIALFGLPFRESKPATKREYRIRLLIGAIAMILWPAMAILAIITLLYKTVFDGVRRELEHYNHLPD